MATPKELFTKYQAAEDAFQAAKDAADKALEARSLTVKAIVDELGSGPFDYNGRSIQAVGRKLKDDDDKVIGTTWFFKGSKKKITVIK